MAARLRPRISPFLLPVSFFLLACLFLWPLALHPGYVPFAPRARFSDLLITHLPNAQYIRDSLVRFGQVPLWNAQILAGQPFFADPLAGLWYPPNWLLLIPGVPLPFAFNILFVLHLAWGAYGLHRFLRAEGLSSPAAFFGAVTFTGTPKLLAHLAAGHVSLVFALAWTPWLLHAVRGAARRGGLRAGTLAGLYLTLIFLADARWAAYAGALAVAYWLSSLPPLAPSRPRGGEVLAAAAFAFSFLTLSAILALPLAQFVGRSSRVALSVTEAGAYSLPWVYLVGLVIPNLGGFHEWMTYLGVIPLLLAFAGLRRVTLFWGLAALTAAAFALGTNFVVFPFLFRLLPGLGFLRVPPRAWFIVALSVAVLAAHGAERLTATLIPRLAQRPALTVLARAPKYFLPVALILTMADLLRVNATLLEARPMPGRVPAAEWIAGQPGLFRVYSPSYSLPPGDGLQHVDGVDPLQLGATVDYLAEATGVGAGGYSVTTPSFAADSVSTANAAARPDPALLGSLNVKYVAAEFSVEVDGLTQVKTFGATRVYENTAARPRAWVDNGRAEVTFWSPNRIVVRASGPGRLVLSEVNYPGWRATVDEKPAVITSVERILQSVELDAGGHTITFEFLPGLLLASAALTVVGAAGVAAILKWAP